jgi:hypothetical protein
MMLFNNFRNFSGALIKEISESLEVSAFFFFEFWLWLGPHQQRWNGRESETRIGAENAIFVLPLVTWQMHSKE